ncbi:MAG TPA: restriction endonuclease subunit S, partial [Candidatus Atribacteria bacterium]|nr:restriction endonuclease subunit S [Candidatus Atribacteria bacterium]
VISAAKSLKKSMMSYLFTYGPVPLPDAENIPQKETEIGMIPEEWEAVRLGDVADLVMGQSPPGSTYNEIGEGLPFLQGKAEFGPLHPRHIKYTTKPIKTAPKNSVLLSVRAPVGDVNIADIDYCIGRGLTSVSLSEGNNLFLFYILSYLKDEIEKEGTGSTFKAITKAKLMNIKIPLPPLPTQQKIASMLSAIDEKIEAEENKKKALEDLFNTLLHNLMTARIRVNHLALDKAELAM